MSNMIKKSDFILTAYMKCDNLLATFQLLNTIVPYLLLWFLAFQFSKISFYLTLPIILLIVLFSLRCFSLMHDCGHNSLFGSKKVNRLVGFLLGVINAMPQYWWSRDHAYHHKTNGNWEVYRGIGDFLSVYEYLSLSKTDRKIYRFLRHPLMVLPGSYFYLAFKPRLILLAGTVDFIRHIVNCLWMNPSIPLSILIDSHKSKHWNSAGEFWDVLFNNIFVISAWILSCHFLGVEFFFVTYSIVLMLSAACFITIFFLQHNFEGSYAHKSQGWNYTLGAIKGSSYLEMPVFMKWFTADISYHSIHHLSERIPNYNLRACYQRNRHLLTKTKTIRISDIPYCSKYILWDSTSDRLVSIDKYC
ncbi:MAG: fatty acid desaturase [Verrucomicrobiota bacterium]